MSRSEEFQQGRLYHVTTPEALPGIRQHGLDNTKATHELWSNNDDWEDGAYVWNHPGHARRYAGELREMGYKPVILGVDPKGLRLTPDDTGDQPVEGAFHAPHVPLSNLQFPKRYRQ